MRKFLPASLLILVSAYAMADVVCSSPSGNITRSMTDGTMVFNFKENNDAEPISIAEADLKIKIHETKQLGTLQRRIGDMRHYSMPVEYTSQRISFSRKDKEPIYKNQSTIMEWISCEGARY